MFISNILQYVGNQLGIIDVGHEARMEAIKANHLNAMKSLQTQSELESAKHKDIMERLEQQSILVGESNKLDVSHLKSKVPLIYRYVGTLFLKIAFYIPNLDLVNDVLSRRHENLKHSTVQITELSD